MQIKTFPTLVFCNSNDPIQITRADILVSEFSLAIDVINLTDHFIDKITFSAKFKNENDEYIYDEEFIFTVNVKIPPHKFYYIKPFVLDENYYAARSLEIKLVDYYTESGHIKIKDNKKMAIYLPIITEKKRAEIKHKLSDTINTYGENLIDYWRCACGTLNQKDENECKFCGRNKSFVLNNLTEPIINFKLLNLLEAQNQKTGTILDEEIRKNLTQTQLTKIAPTKENAIKNRINIDKFEFEKNRSPLNIFFKYLFKFIIAVMVLSFCFNIGMRAKNEFSLIRANNLLQSGEYQAALNRYMKIKQKYVHKNYEDSLEKARHLTDSDNAYKVAIKFYSKNDLINAAYYFKKVIPGDFLNFQDAEDNILDIENRIIQKAKDMRNTNQEQSIKLLDEFLEIVPESAVAINLKRNILENSYSDTNKKEEYEKDQDQKQDRAYMSEIAQNLMHSYQNVVSENANLRSEPDVNSKIITVLKRGTELYVLDTKIESSERIWLYVQTKESETEKSYEGWISNKTIKTQR